MSTTDIRPALDALTVRSRGYARARAYYDGDQPLMFATDKFRNAFGPLFVALADNLCARIVDTVADRLVVTGFRLAGNAPAPRPLPAPGAPRSRRRTRTPADRAWELWEAQHLPRRAGRAMLAALREGDAFVIVDQDAAGQVSIHPQGRNAQVTVKYDAENGTALQWATKLWTADDGKIRLNLYYPDHTERYVTRQATQGVIPVDDKAFALLPADGEIPNPAGRIPVFHLASNADLGEFGTSELKDVIPLQDALNKSLCDMMVGMEFNAFPQRTAVGLDLEVDELTGKATAPLVPGADRLWAVANPNVKFGEFPAAGLDNYLNVQNNLRIELARVSATPLHYLALTSGRFPSGEALRIAETPLVNKVVDREGGFGDTWASVLAYALYLVDGTAADLVAEWADPWPHSELAQAQRLTLEQGMGVPEPVLWAKLGYSDSEIEQMLALRAAWQALLAAHAAGGMGGAAADAGAAGRDATGSTLG